MKRVLNLLLLFLLIFFTSCDNFMNGSTVQEQLSEMIDVANAKSFTLIVSQETSMGSFLSSGDKSCKLGYSIDVQYTVKKDLYIYKGLKAVSSSDNTISRNDYVEFTTIDSDDARGIYKVSIKLVKECSDIYIIPDCVLIPNIDLEACKPVSTITAEQDSNICIAFNKPVQVDDFIDYSINDTAGQNLIDYFGEPYFSADSQTLYIPTINQKYLIPLTESETTTKEIIVKINLSSFKDLEGYKGNGVASYKYRVNKKIDSTKPVLTAIKLCTTDDTESAYYKELSSKPFTQWSGTQANPGEYAQNHTAASIYVEIEGTDEGSGISGFLVKETLIKNTDGSDADSTVNSYHVPCTSIENTESYKTSYNLNSLYDGIIELEFFAEDNAGNCSEKSVKYYVLKDTKIDDAYIKFKEEFGQFEETPAVWKTVIPVVEGDTQNVSITLSDDAKDKWYTGFTSDYTINAYWGYSEDEITNSVSTNGKNFSFTRDVTKFVYIKLICEDDLGNIKEIIKHMPQKAEVCLNDNGWIDLAKKDLTFIMHGDLESATSQMAINLSEKQSSFIYRFYNDTSDPTNYSEIILGTERRFMYDFTFDIPYACKQFGKEDYTGRLDIFLSSKIGDFPSPRSSNYYTTTITGWNPPQYEGGYPVPLLGEGSIPVTTNENNNEVINSFGPEGNPYLNKTIKIKAEAKLNTGAYKLTFSDYLTQEGKDKNIEVTFYVLSYGQKGYEGAEKFWLLENSIVSKTPELYALTQNYYLIFLEAYDSQNKKIYAPYAIPAYSTNPVIPEIENYSYSFYLNDETSTKTELRLEKDLTPPFSNMDQGMYDETIYMFNSATNFEIRTPADAINIEFIDYDEATLYKNEAGNYELSYYIIPNTNDSLNLLPKYTINELETSYSAYEQKFEYTMDSPMDIHSLKIPYGNISEGFYTLSVILKDKYGNEAIYSYPFINNSLGSLPYTRQLRRIEDPDDPEHNSLLYYYDFTIDTEDSAHPEIKTITKDGEEISAIDAYLEKASTYEGRHWATWGLMGMHNNICYTQSEPNGSATVTYTPTFTHTFKVPSVNGVAQGAWYRLRAYYGFNDSLSVKDKGFYTTEYMFLGPDIPEYYNPDRNNSWFTCNLKNCFDGLNGVQIFADNDVLVHTMYSPYKITDSRFDKDAITLWENKGIETGLEVYERPRPIFEPYQNPDDPYSILQRMVVPDGSINENYDLSHLKDIPEGYWYTTIVRFVDGTTLMTDIKQK